MKSNQLAFLPVLPQLVQERVPGRWLATRLLLPRVLSELHVPPVGIVGAVSLAQFVREFVDDVEAFLEHGLDTVLFASSSSKSRLAFGTGSRVLNAFLSVAPGHSGACRRDILGGVAILAGFEGWHGCSGLRGSRVAGHEYKEGRGEGRGQETGRRVFLQ